MQEKFPPAVLPTIELGITLRTSNIYFHLDRLRRSYSLQSSGLVYDIKSGLKHGTWDRGENGIFVIHFEMSPNITIRLESKGRGDDSAQRELFSVDFSPERGVTKTKLGFIYKWEENQQPNTIPESVAMRLRAGQSITISEKNMTPKFTIAGSGFII
jgi:hypothetical protein